MVRRVSWCTLVALVVLFFVTAEGLRERNTQIENHKTTNRGSLRFNSKSLEDSTTASSPLTRSKLTRDRSAQLKRFSSFSKPNDVSTLASVIDLASNFDSNRQPNVRTTRTTERGSLSDVKTDSGRATSEKKPVEPNKDLDPTVNRRNGKRYEVNEGPNSKTNEPKVPLDAFKGVPRRTFNGRVSPTWGTNHGPTERLDNKGPSVFLATTESSRSRTGRKIQTTYSMKDLKTQIPTSRRYTKKFEDLETTTLSFRRDGRGRSTTEKIERSTRSGRSKLASRENNYITRRGPDPLLTESESVRVDIPLEVGATETPLSDATTAFSVISQRRSDTKDSSRSNTRTGPKNRARSSDSEAAGSSRSGSRRGSSKFSDSTTTEADEQIVSSRKNAVPRDRSRGADAKKNTVVESRARSRGRNLENNVKPVSSGSYERDGKRKVIGERNPSDRRTRILDGSLRSVENRGQDSQDTRARSRNRSRSETTTPTTTDVTSTVAPDTTVSNDVTTVDPEPTSTTIGPATPATPASTTSSPRTTTRPSASTTTSTTESPGRPRGRGRGNQGRKQKEDFFNHGLGFRGRKPSLEGSSNVSDARRFIPSKNDSYGNPGWTLRRRPAHVNSSENTSRMVATTPRDQTNEVIPPNEQSTSTEASTTVESSTRRGFKKPQSSEETSTVAGGTTKSSRRGNKTFGFGKSEESEESDNYPPEFKARLTQLKNLSTKIPAPKTTSRSPLEERRKSIYGRRPRNNSKAFELDDLETSASGNVMTDENLVVNPLTLINATGLRRVRVKKSSAGLFAERSRMKLELARRLVKPELNIEENDLDATTASSFSKPKPNGVPVVDQASIIAKYPNPAATGRRSPSSVENTRDEASVKPAKLADPRTGLEEYSPKVTGSRPYNLKKGRIIAERMVTSISIEEKPAVEDTTRPYVLSTNPSVIASAEESSATTIDSARIRVNNRGGKKSKEEDSPPWKHAKVSLYSTQTVENNDPVTTATPKKSYAYQSRNSKSQEQATTIEQNPTTSVPKKSYASTQRKLQTSHEEAFGKKSRLASSATKTTFRPRYSKRTKQKSVEEKTIDYQVSVTTKMPIATSRYSRKKSAVKASEEKSKSVTSQGISTQTRKTEFRPRTATYRRHSDVLTTSVESTTRAEGTGVAITPRSSKYHATLKTSTEPTRSVAQEPQVNLRIANESTPETPETPGITGSSNGDSGNTNIFNPTRSTFLSGNNTLLEQLRSTVAPLLSSLGNKTPVFSGAYSNVNTANSPPRITPNGQPPRFSARYKGAELFVRKQNNIYQPTVPSITSSSTTPVTPVENSGLPPPIDVSSPGEPRFLTLYQALESVSVRNEQLQGNASMQREEQVGMVPQVDSNAAVANGTGDNANNDTTSPTVATSGPQTPDTTANTIQDSTQTPRLPEDTENSTPAVTTGAPETPSTTEPVFTSTEPSSSTEQASTSTESLADNEQLSTSTVSSFTAQQISANTMPVTDQTTTESPLSRTTEATTMNIGAAVDSRLSAQVDNTSMSQELQSSTTDTIMTTSSAPDGSSTQLDESTSTTMASTEAQSTESQRLVNEVTPSVDENTIETTTTSMIVTTTSVTTSENPETNTIPLSETTVTQTVEVSSTTETPTTEAESSNMIDVETTTAIPTTTIRNRLIDFAQDILSRLQASMSTTTTVPAQDSTTIAPATEISNVIPDSSSNSSMESLSQLRSETTTVEGESTTLSTEDVTTESADSTSATAQGTAGSGIGQTTEIGTTIPDSSTTPPSSTPESSTVSPPDSSLLRTTSSPAETTTATITTETATSTSTGTSETTRMDVVTVTPVTETTTPGVNIAENLVSTEPGTTTVSTESTIGPTSTVQASTSSGNSSTETSTVQTTTSSRPQAATTPYMGRFGGSRLTPAPRFSLSSTTKGPLRDYLVYGIYPNKTIVRKRPEDNLIDARNVDSPYVIFGIFPDGRLVRKFPNGTIIPDPPRSPVESNALLNTQMGTTSVTPIVSTGRPPTDSQGGRIVQDRERDEATRTKEAEGQRSSVYIGQDKFVNYWTDGASTSNPRVLSVNINSVASGANEGPSPSLPTFENLLNNQRRGQVTAPPGFPWRDPLEQIFGITTSSPVISASVASNTLDDTSEPNGPVLARPINPFVEVFTPFSSVIGVPRGNVGTIPPPPSSTTPVSMATNATMSTTTPASSTSTTTTTPTTTTTTTTTMAPTTTTTTTMAPTTTTTTTMAPTTTTTTTMAPTTTTTTTITTTTAPTTTTMAPTTTTTQSTTTAQRANLVSQVGSTSGTTASQTNSFNVPKSLFSPQQQNAFGTTFDDLAFLNSLLQSNSRSTTQKTLTQVEQLLANKILALALNNPGPTRAPKAIDVDNVSSNSIFEPVTKSPSQPIVIDLSPSSTTSLPTWSSVETQQLTSQKPIINSTPDRVTWKPVTTTSSKKDIELNTISTSSGDKFTLISTTKGPVNVKGRTVTTPRPRTTSPAPLGIAGFLWQTLLGGSLYRTSTTPKPVKAKPVPKTTPKSVNITPKPIQPSVPSKTVDILKIRVNTPNSEMKDIVSTTKQPLLNNPNPRLPNVVTSTYSPEEDAKFLVELLRAVEQDNKVSDSRKTAELTLKDDESVLRAVLSGRTYTTTTPPSTTEMSNAALLAALLKARGIEPSTPSTKIREQLLSASLGQSVTSAPASEAATITTRQASTLARAVDSVKKTATPRSISATTKTRTTTWSPSSTYPPPLFSSFSNFGNPGQSANGDNSRNSALFGATRAFSQFLGAAISGAAQQLQSLVRNGTKIVSDVVG